MLDVERLARDLRLTAIDPSWEVSEESPHLWPFSYAIARRSSASETFEPVGTVVGYRIVQDWTVRTDLELWDEADAVDPDAVLYVDSLIRELRACAAVFGVSPSLSDAQRITIVRHVEPIGAVDSTYLIQGVVASLARMDAPVFMLVDPWPLVDELGTAAGRMRGRRHIASLLQIGFVRMVSSRFVWAWNTEMAECLLADYCHDELLAAKRTGSLDEELGSRLAEEPQSLPFFDETLIRAGLRKPGDATDE